MGRGRIVGCLFAALLLPVLTAWPAHAQGTTKAGCTFVFPAHFSPGVTRTPGTVAYGSGGETGSITCVGTIDSHRVRGPGSFGFEGTYTGDCFSNVGSGTYSFTVPTDAGRKHFSGTYTESRLGHTGPVNASQAGARFTGHHVVVPTKGDCVTTPVTDALVYMVGSLRG